MNGLDVTSESLAALFSVDRALWRQEVAEIGAYFARYGARLPAALLQELAVTQKLLG
jgi:GTP-dependent phosphoenolpyruvate carboxykinase